VLGSPNGERETKTEFDYILTLVEANVSKKLLVETMTRVGRWNWQKSGQLVRKVIGTPGGKCWNSLCLL